MHDDDSAGPEALPPSADPFLSNEGARLRLIAVTTMTDTLAHRLRDPLSAAMNFLNGAARLTSSRQDADQLLAVIEEARQQTLKAVDIVRRMHVFAVDGRVERRAESLAAMLATIRSDLVFDGRVRDELEVSIYPGADAVLVDRLLVEQALRNILLNAVDAIAGRDTRRIQVEAWRRDGEVEIAVRDTGGGLPDVPPARLFESCFSTRPGRGGLGLPVARAIVEAHGGRIWAAASSADGADFRVALPAAGD